MRSIYRATGLLLLISFLAACGSDDSETGGTNNAPANIEFDIAGEYIEGQTLTVSPSITDDNGLTNAVFTYTWYADGVVIESNSSNVLILDASHIAQSIYFTISFTDDSGFNESASSDAVVVTMMANRDAQFDVSFSNDFEEQKTVVVTANITDEDGAENPSPAYAWYFDGELIASNTTNSISLLPEDNNKELNFEITFTDDRGHLETYSSDLYTVADKLELTVITTNEIELFAGKSNDLGVTWLYSGAIDPVEFDTVSDQEIEMIDIHAAADNNGNIIAVLTEDLYEAFGGDTDVVYIYSNDNGESFSEIQLINPADTMDSASSVTARVVTDKKGTWVITWNTSDEIESNGTDADIVFAVSSNNGQSFSTPKTMNPESLTDSARDSDASLAIENNIWTAVWTSSLVIDGDVGTDRDVLSSYSEDKGQTWSAAVHVNSWATTDVETDYFPIIDMNSTGFAVTAWSGYNGSDNLNIYVATSNDFGKTWSNGVLINQYYESDGTSDQDYPTGVIVTEDNIAIISWKGETQLYGSDSDVFYSVSIDSGETWSVEQGFNSDFSTDSSNEDNLEIKQANDGTWIGYYQDNSNRNMYMRTSNDLETWSDSVLVTDDSHYRSSIVIH